MNINGMGAIVTGAGSGMGRATARLLADAGAKAVLLDINQTAVTAVAAETGGVSLPCNVADPQSLKQAVAAGRAAVGPVRILVTCAGVGRMEPLIGGPDDETYARMLDTIMINLMGTLNAVRLVANDLAALPPLSDGQRGVIIMVASGAAFDGVPYSVPYTASKGAIVAMTLGLAREFGDLGIRVNTISPGGFDTAMIKGAPQEALDSIKSTTPFPKRMGAPAEFAAMVRHICENDFLNGSVLRLDGAHRTGYFSPASSSNVRE